MKSPGVKPSRDTSRQERQTVPYFPLQAPIPPDAAVDERNGWHEPDRGNPLRGFDDERISDCADELGRLFHWLLFGGSARRGQPGMDGGHGTDTALKQDVLDVLRRPETIGVRMVAAVLLIRPDLLNDQAMDQIARKLRISSDDLTGHADSFGEHFPGAVKVSQRCGRLMAEANVHGRSRAAPEARPVP